MCIYHQSTQTHSRKQNQSQRKNPTEHCNNQTDHQNCPNVVIVEDSMIKHLEPAKLDKGLRVDRVTFRTFAGAKTEDMKHYLQPTLRARPRTSMENR